MKFRSEPHEDIPRDEFSELAMKGSWRLGSIAGIGVYLHFTCLVLLAWVVVNHYFRQLRWEDAASGIAFVAAFLLFFLLHELGHALTAKRFGIRTCDITLFPLGGMARLEHLPADPFQELLLAVAGPAVNFVLGMLLIGVQLATTGWAPLELRLGTNNIITNMILLNICLAMFNLLPAFPMDGGRILRAFLAMRMDYQRATNIAAQLGKAMAVLLGFIGLWIDPFLVLVALFVWIGAADEAKSGRNIERYPRREPGKAEQ